MPNDNTLQAALQQFLMGGGPSQGAAGAFQGGPNYVPGAPAGQTGIDPTVLASMLLGQGGLMQQQQSQLWDAGGAGAGAGLYNPVALGMAPGAPLPYSFPTLPWIGMPMGPSGAGGGVGGGGGTGGSPATTPGERMRSGQATQSDRDIFAELKASLTPGEGQIIDEQTGVSGPSGSNRNLK